MISNPTKRHVALMARLGCEAVTLRITHVDFPLWRELSEAGFCVVINTKRCDHKLIRITDKGNQYVNNLVSLLYIHAHRSPGLPL